jgi:hypothetical protein
MQFPVPTIATISRFVRQKELDKFKLISHRFHTVGMEENQLRESQFFVDILILDKVIFIRKYIDNPRLVMYTFLIYPSEFVDILSTVGTSTRIDTDPGTGTVSIFFEAFIASDKSLKDIVYFNDNKLITPFVNLINENSKLAKRFIDILKTLDFSEEIIENLYKLIYISDYEKIDLSKSFERPGFKPDIWYTNVAYDYYTKTFTDLSCDKHIILTRLLVSFIHRKSDTFFFPFDRIRSYFSPTHILCAIYGILLGDLASRLISQENYSRVRIIFFELFPYVMKPDVFKLVDQHITYDDEYGNMVELQGKQILVGQLRKEMTTVAVRFCDTKIEDILKKLNDVRKTSSTKEVFHIVPEYGTPSEKEALLRSLYKHSFLDKDSIFEMGIQIMIPNIVEEFIEGEGGHIQTLDSVELSEIDLENVPKDNVYTIVKFIMKFNDYPSINRIYRSFIFAIIRSLRVDLIPLLEELLHLEELDQPGSLFDSVLVDIDKYNKFVAKTVYLRPLVKSETPLIEPCLTSFAHHIFKSAGYTHIGFEYNTPDFSLWNLNGYRGYVNEFSGLSDIIRGILSPKQYVEESDNEGDW